MKIDGVNRSEPDVMALMPDAATSPAVPELCGFRSALVAWFTRRVGLPTPVQAAAWPVIAGGESALIAAPTGTGKTLAAWLPVIDRLLSAPDSPSRPGVRAVYVSPLRALSRDMLGQLTRPLDDLAAAGLACPRLGLRTGDTPSSERQRQLRRPPEILVTTPESLYVLLGSAGGRRMLATVETVMVDEIHALADNKRGAHLSLSLERLEELAGCLQRIGISATQKPLADMAGFLAGDGRHCRVLEPMPDRRPEIALELPDLPLGPFAHSGHWSWIHARLAELAGHHHSVLVFCNTRAGVERTARALAEWLGEEAVAAHHGSLGRARRDEVERGLREGRLRLVVTSASLELGLDLGAVDLVCQLGSPGAINLLRQRAGRACHRPGTRPRAALFPLTRGDLLDAHALLDALEDGELDTTRLPDGPADVLCQHLVAMTAAGCDDPEALYARVRRAWPWRRLERSHFDAVVDMLVDGFVPGREAAGALVARSADGRRLVPAPRAGRLARAAGGTIPEWFEYRVLRQSDRADLGGLDEEFAFESAPGQIMQLGNRILRILKITGRAVYVEPAPDETPNVPFWFGDAPGRTNALSARVRAVLARHDRGDVLARTAPAAVQLAAYLAESRRVLGALPGPARIVVERFFDPGGDQHLVLHAPLGARINRAWGLALRKRFCRQFNFELQAAATENGVLISLGATHSFDLAEPLAWLKSGSVRAVLIQALLDTPLYLTRFRWCANTALAIPRSGPRGPVAPQLQRNQAENLVARVFPDQLACLENLSGEREVPDHPLVRQALDDCLHDHLDVSGLEAVLARLEAGTVTAHTVESPAPSPLAEAMIHAPRHAFLDPAGAEERRTRSFESAPAAAGVAVARESGGLAAARRQAWRRVVDADLEHALVSAGYLTAREGETGISATGAPGRGGRVEAFRALVRRQAAVAFRPDAGRCLWVALDRLADALAIWSRGAPAPALPEALMPAPADDPEAALCRVLVRRLGVTGPAEAGALAAETGLPATLLEGALARLRQEGCVMQVDSAWCLREHATRLSGDQARACDPRSGTDSMSTP